jgi:hypothetical protein
MIFTKQEQNREPKNENYKSCNQSETNWSYIDRINHQFKLFKI